MAAAPPYPVSSPPVIAFHIDRAAQDIRLSPSSTTPWTLQSLDLDRIEFSRIRHNEDLFFLLCSASLVESGADLHIGKLVDHFVGDQELQTWLSQHWAHDKLQHGRALAAYVRKVWPEFDWNRGFETFWKDYRTTSAKPLEPSRGLELAARCVLKTGTASHYRALHEITDEPVLKQLTDLLKADSVRHYRHFYHHYRLHRQREGFGRYKVFRTILRRVRDIRAESNSTALRHVFDQCYPQHQNSEIEFRRISDRAHGLMRQNLPATMTAKMLLKPLELPTSLQTGLEKPVARLTERFLMR